MCVGCEFFPHRRVLAKSLQSLSISLKLCSPPGSSVQGILQARTLERVAISFSWGYSRPRYQTCISLCLLYCQADFFYRQSYLGIPHTEPMNSWTPEGHHALSRHLQVFSQYLQVFTNSPNCLLLGFHGGFFTCEQLSHSLSPIPLSSPEFGEEVLGM